MNSYPVGGGSTHAQDSTQKPADILVALKDKYPKASTMWLKKTDALAELIMQDNRPLNIINGTGFQVMPLGENVPF